MNDSSAQQPTAILKQDTLFFAGDWTDYGNCPDWQDILPSEASRIPLLKLDATAVTGWNTAFITYLFNLLQACKVQQIECDWTNLPHGIIILLNLAFAVPEKQLPKPPKAESKLASIGASALSVYQKVLSALDFLGLMLTTTVCFALHQTRTKYRDIIFQIARCGHQALGIVSLIGFLIGVILAFLGCIPLRMFGAEIYVASLVGIGVVRMMAPTMVGVVMAGRTSAAFAAELGAMQVNEEVDAYIAMGLSPADILVLPRFLALSITLPLLCLYADLLGIFGGIAVGIYYSGIGFKAYTNHLMETTSLNDFLVGLFTAWIFGILISLCGCYHGLHCGRNSTAVGQATTSAVVSSIVCMVFATAIITVSTVFLGV